MSSIATAVFKATIGMLVNKGRDKAAEKLKDGDVIDQKFRGLIVREIDDIKSKLDGLSKKDLLASISFFEEGIGFLYKVFEEARITSEHDGGATATHAGKTGSNEFVVYEFSNTADLHHKFPVGEEGWIRRLTVTNSKVLVRSKHSVDVYDTDGLFLRSFGEGIRKGESDITAANDGRVMVVDWDDYVHIFSEDGDYLDKFKLQGHYFQPRIAFHILSEHVVIAGVSTREDREELVISVEIFTKDGEFVRTQIHERGRLYFPTSIEGMTVTLGGGIAVLLGNMFDEYKLKAMNDK